MGGEGFGRARVPLSSCKRVRALALDLQRWANTRPARTVLPAAATLTPGVHLEGCTTPPTCGQRDSSLDRNAMQMLPLIY